MMRLSRAMHSFITLLCMVVIFLGLLLIPLVPWGPESAGAASVSWPAEVELLANQAVTQTAQYRFLNVVGAGECQHVYYATGTGTTTGTYTITVDGRWRGATFATQTVTGTVTDGAGETGMITVATSAPHYPQVRTSVEVDAGTFTPTISFVGQ
jgi:hypothetical protein